MAAFKKTDRPAGPYYLSPTLPGFGRVGPWSTGLRSKAQAESMERWLKETAVTDPEAVRGIVVGSYTLREAYVAHKERRLDALKQVAKDPPLREVLARYRPPRKVRVHPESLESGQRSRETAYAAGAQACRGGAARDSSYWHRIAREERTTNEDAALAAFELGWDTAARRGTADR